MGAVLPLLPAFPFFCSGLNSIRFATQVAANCNGML